MMKAGFSRLDITPPLGSDLSGYFTRRAAKGVLDPLYINAVAIQNGTQTLVLIAIDYIGIDFEHSTKIRELISERTSVPTDCIIISALHQHTSPCIADVKKWFTALRDDTFLEILYRKLGDAAVMAMDDLKDASLSTASKETDEPISFVRRYFTKENGVQTNPSTSKNILLGRCDEADNTVRLVRFSREGANDIALVNFSTHPDVIGGEYISADWPGFTRRFVEEYIPGVSCAFFTGCQGDSNHIDFFKPKTERIKNNDGYCHSRYMGETVAAAVKDMWNNTKPCDSTDIFAKSVTVYNRTNLQDVDKYDEYKAWYDDYEAGRLGYDPSIAELAYASRIIQLRTSKIFRPIPISVLGFGDILFVGFGGEPFTSYGDAIRALAPDKFVVCAVCTNGYEGYFPTKEAFEQGGYEALSSLFTPSVEEEIISAVNGIFKSLK